MGKPREINYLFAYTEINNLDTLESELEKFKDMAQSIRRAGFLEATEFEYKLLKKALDEGPERLAQTVRQITPEVEQEKLMRLAQHAQKFLPYVDSEEFLSDWARKQINRYLVKGKLNCECEVKLSEMVRSLTESFIINTMIKATGEEDEWETLVKHLRQNLISLNGVEEHLS